jgi:hypothetical protein
MATDNPTGRGPGISLAVPVADAEFLRRLFTMALEGIRDELDNHPGNLREPTRLHREEGIYEALLAALDGAPIIPDHYIRQVLRDLTEMNDRENGYACAVAEHEALVGLLGQLSGSMGAA